MPDVPDAGRVKQTDFYNHARRFGLTYEGSFQIVNEQTVDGQYSKLITGSPWIAHLDGMMQTPLLQSRSLGLPTMIGQVLLERPVQTPTESMSVVHTRLTKSNEIEISCAGALISGVQTTPTSLKTMRCPYPSTATGSCHTVK